MYSHCFNANRASRDKYPSTWYTQASREGHAGNSIQAALPLPRKRQSFGRCRLTAGCRADDVLVRVCHLITDGGDGGYAGIRSGGNRDRRGETDRSAGVGRERGGKSVGRSGSARAGVQMARAGTSGIGRAKLRITKSSWQIGLNGLPNFISLLRSWQAKIACIFLSLVLE